MDFVFASGQRVAQFRVHLEGVFISCTAEHPSCVCTCKIIFDVCNQFFISAFHRLN